MKYKANVEGTYVSLTFNHDTREVSIHESKFLRKGDKMDWPKGAFIMLVVAKPESRLED